MWSRRPVGLATLATLALVVAGCGGGTGKGTIVASGRGGVFTLAPDGSGRTRIAGLGDAGDVAWSRDGKRVAFVRGRRLLGRRHDRPRHPADTQSRAGPRRQVVARRRARRLPERGGLRALLQRRGSARGLDHGR